MAQETLLELVQSVMDNMNRAEISSIFDLEESHILAKMARDVYFLLINEADWSSIETIIELGSAADNTRPNYMVLPQNLTEVHEIKYNVRTSTDTKDLIKTINRITPRQFLEITQLRDSSATNTTQVTDFGGAKYQIYNDTAPKYWTSFDDAYVAFDSYDSVVDDCLVASKSTAIVALEPAFIIADDFVPDLPNKLFPYYKARLNETARARLHGEILPTDTRDIKKHRARMYGTESRTNIKASLNYGRK